MCAWCVVFWCDSLLKRGNSSVQVESLRKLNNLLGSWNSVKIYCQKNNWTRKIIDHIFPEYCSMLILSQNHHTASNNTNSNSNSNSVSSGAPKFSDNMIEPILGKSALLVVVVVIVAVVVVVVVEVVQQFFSFLCHVFFIVPLSLWSYFLIDVLWFVFVLLFVVSRIKREC